MISIDDEQSKMAEQEAFGEELNLELCFACSRYHQKKCSSVSESSGRNSSVKWPSPMMQHQLKQTDYLSYLCKIRREKSYIVDYLLNDIDVVMPLRRNHPEGISLGI